MAAFESFPTSGIVSLNSWTMAPDGSEYMYFFCSDWSIRTDKEMPVVNFRSRERWHLVAKNHITVIAMFPGCQVMAFVATDYPPSDTHGASKFRIPFSEKSKPARYFNLSE